jgi:hypothetical protein
MKLLLGTRLRERRLALGRKQGEVAAAAGISAAYLNLIEFNRRAVAGDVLGRLGAVLGFAADDLAATDGGLADELRQAAASVGADAGQVQEFVARFPAWADVLVAQAQRAAGLERAVAALNDRISHDPHLSATLHDMLSAATAVRATAGILAETADIDAPTRSRFHQTLAAESERLAGGAQALVAYLDGAQQEGPVTAMTPQDEVAAWLAARDWHLAEAEDGDIDTAGIAALASAAARDLAQAFAQAAVRDAASMPLAAIQQALQSHGPDPVRLAREFGVDVIAACRRLAGLPDVQVGLVMCDGAGAMTFRRPVPGFALPRAGAGCSLWPLYTALGRPMQAVEAIAEGATQPAPRFLLRAFCQVHLPQGFGVPERREAAMLILPAPSGPPAQMVVGPTCRICPVSGCSLRREPSTLTGRIGD